MYHSSGKIQNIISYIKENLPCEFKGLFHSFCLRLTLSAAIKGLLNNSFEWIKKCEKNM